MIVFNFLKKIALLLFRLLFTFRILKFYKKPDTKAKLLNYGLVIGSGKQGLYNWVNTDLDFRVSYLDVSKKFPIASNSVSRIYAEHVIEHLELSVFRNMLTESYRILRFGGVIRIVVPDLESHVKLYLSNSLEATEYLTDLKKQSLQGEHRTDIVRSFATYWGHERGYFWDFKSLYLELISSKFLEIKQQSVGTSTDPLFANLESRTDILSKKLQLVVEAKKYF